MRKCACLEDGPLQKTHQHANALRVRAARNALVHAMDARRLLLRSWPKGDDAKDRVADRLIANGIGTTADKGWHHIDVRVVVLERLRHLCVACAAR